MRALAQKRIQATDKQRRDTELATNSLRAFVEQAWPTVEPAHPFIGNWHIDAICSHLQAVSDGDIKRLLINICPGSAKSLLVSVLWPSWMWITNPQWRGIIASYAGDLVIRDAVRSRSLIDSPWYQQTFKPDWEMSLVQNSKTHFENTKKGSRFSTSVGSRVMGFRADYLIIDDANNTKEQNSDTKLDEVIEWWTSVMPSRLNNLATGAKVVIGQRVSERDLSGHILKEGGYVHLNIPTEYEGDRRCTTVYGNGKTWTDPRTQEGELMFPVLFPRHVIEEAKHDMGSMAFAGQHQQRPVPAGGGIIKRYWWNFWQAKGSNMAPIQVKLGNGTTEARLPVTLPQRMDITLLSFDMAFKGKQTSDFMVGLCIAACGADRYILDCERGRFDMPETLMAIRRLSARNPQAHLKLVESKANGPAAVQSLRHEISGMVEVEPQGGKNSRVAAAAVSVESGNWHLPHPALCPWVSEFLAELSAFPSGENDDFVDSFSQAAIRLMMVAPRNKNGRQSIEKYLPSDNLSGDRSWMV